MNAMYFRSLGTRQTHRGAGEWQDARSLNRMRLAVRFLVAGSMLGLTAHGAQAHCEQHMFRSASVAQLKNIYLRCAEVSSRMVLDMATMGRCSAAADELRDRGFNGNFEQLIAWWHSNRAPMQSSSSGDDSASVRLGSTHK